MRKLFVLVFFLCAVGFFKDRTARTETSSASVSQDLSSQKGPQERRTQKTSPQRQIASLTSPKGGAEAAPVVKPARLQSLIDKVHSYLLAQLASPEAAKKTDREQELMYEERNKALEGIRSQEKEIEIEVDLCRRGNLVSCLTAEMAGKPIKDFPGKFDYYSAQNPPADDLAFRFIQTCVGIGAGCGLAFDVIQNGGDQGVLEQILDRYCDEGFGSSCFALYDHLSDGSQAQKDKGLSYLLYDCEKFQTFYSCYDYATRAPDSASRTHANELFTANCRPNEASKDGEYICSDGERILVFPVNSSSN